jgi:hypothetical protein
MSREEMLSRFEELDAGRVRHAAHQPAERVHLAHERALADAADRRVARHDADRVDPLRHEQRARAVAEEDGRKRVQQVRFSSLAYT